MKDKNRRDLFSPHNVNTDRTISERGTKEVRNFHYLSIILDDDHMTAFTGEDSDHPLLREGKGEWE